MIAQVCSLGHIAHPIAPNLTCPVLQYADDTLILAHATSPAATHLRSILDDLAAATGLGINFHKLGYPSPPDLALNKGGWLALSHCHPWQPPYLPYASFLISKENIEKLKKKTGRSSGLKRKLVSVRNVLPHGIKFALQKLRVVWVLKT
jgi:hypothetical protein